MHTMKVMLADDDSAFVATYQKILEKEGFVVVPARDGDEAVQLAFGEKPDVVILDVDMPGKDGLAVMQELRSSEWGKEVPIVILTGKEPDNARLEQINRWRPTYYFVKGDQSVEEFVSTITDLAKSGDAAAAQS